MHCILEGGERDFVVGWMKGLKGCGRFKLNVCFLDDGQVKVREERERWRERMLCFLCVCACVCVCF